MVVRICEMPTQGKNSFKAVAEVLEITDSNFNVYNVQGKILLYLKNDSMGSTIRYGDKLFIASSPDLPQAAINPHQYDHRKNLLRKGILYTDYLTPSHYHVLSHDTSSLYSRLMFFRETVIRKIKFSSLEPSQQGIVEALILGWKQDLDEETQTSFRKAGITHLLCVSGLHVGIIAFLVALCLSFISNKKRGRIIKGALSLTAIWLFILLTGMAPGTTRAGIMFSVITVGKVISKQSSTLNSIAASALIMLLCRPAILFDIGFQLSYTAVIGIVLFAEPMERLSSFRKQKADLQISSFCFQKDCGSLYASAPLLKYPPHPLYFTTFTSFLPIFS